MVGLIGRKLGMTQLYNENEELIPVTVVSAGPCPVVNVRSSDKNGYSAVQLAYEPVTEKKINQPKAGQFKKAGVAPHRFLQEIRTTADGQFEVGQVLDVSGFEVGEIVEVTGKSKGKGFAGVVKRFGFRGKNATHGTPGRVRHGGSIGQGTTPGKVFKGKKMPGQMGNRRVTTKGLAVVRVDAERHLLFLKGAVPGGKNGFVIIRKK